MKHVLFCLGFATYSAHTLDSMVQCDWRLIFPDLSDQDGAFVYVLGHIPLVALVIWLTSHHSSGVRGWSRLIFCVFLILHVAIHKKLEENAQYTFHSQLSQALIYSSGLLGLLY